MQIKFLLLSIVFLMSACYSGGVKRTSITKSEAESAMAKNRTSAKVKAIWIREINKKKDTDFYLEAAQDGSVLSREEENGAITTRRGKITARLAKDLIRETERAEAMSGRAKLGFDFMSTGGMKVYAYISGELNIAEATMTEMGNNFDYALGELAKEVSLLPIEKEMSGMLYCEVVAEDDLPQVNKRIAIDGEIEIIETADVKKFPPLLAAVIDQGRMIPIENKDKTRELTDFINRYDLYGSRAEFILPSTRGTFTCQMKSAYRAGSIKTEEEKYEDMDL